MIAYESLTRVLQVLNVVLEEEPSATTDAKFTMLCYVKIEVNGKQLLALAGCGVRHNFMKEEVARHLKLRIEPG